MKCPTRGKRFYCREWVFSRLLHALDACSATAPSATSTARTSTSTASSTKSLSGEDCAKDATFNSAGGNVNGNVVLLSGAPGCGKTAICGEIVWPSVVISRQSELNARLLAYHFCQLDDSSTLSAGRFIWSLTRQLMDCPHVAAEYTQRVVNDPKRKAWLPSENGMDGSAVRAEQFPKEAFKKTILEPLRECAQPAQNLCLIVDLAHDDSCSMGGTCACASGGVAELLAVFRRALPKWLTLIITSRRQCRYVSRAFHGCRRVALDDLRRSCVVRDVQQYILHRLDEDEPLRLQLNLETAEMLNQLHIKSNGCILYLELVLDGVVDGFTALSETQHIPSTLNGLYLWLCQRLFARKHYFAKVQPIFDVMLAAKKPLTADELFQCVRTSDLNIPVDEFLDRMKAISRLLWLDEERCIFVHHSFAEWLSDVKYATQKYLCDKTSGHSYLAMWYSARGPELTHEECIDFAYHLCKMRIKPPLDESHLPLWLVQSGAPVQRLVLANFAYDEATTRLLIDAGADFVSLDFHQREAQTNFENEDNENADMHSAENGCNDIEEDEGLTGEKSDVFDTTVLPDAFQLNSRLITQREETKIPKIDPKDNNVDSSNNDAGLTDEIVVDADGKTNLHAAASEGRVSCVKTLLARGAFCDVEDKSGNTPLILAARHGHSAVCEQLLEAGAEGDHFNRDGWTALRSAAWGGHLSVIETLLRFKNVSADRCSTDGRSALRAAAWGGHEDCVRILLAKGADANKQDADGRSALMAAAYMGHAEVVDILLFNGADPNLRDRDGRTALGVAAVCSSATPVDHVSVARLLIDRGATVDCSDGNGKTPLQCAASEGNLQMCRLLLEKNADVDHTDNNQCTPLLASAAVGHGSIVKLLLEYRADIDSIDHDGRTVLTVAAAHGCCEVVKMLVEKGLDEMHKDNGGWIPLHHAAFEGHAEVCRLLCDYNSRTVQVIDNEGRHPLILAVEEGHLEAARALIEYGANVNKPALDGQTPLRIATVGGHKAICHLLISRGADVDYNDLDGRSTLYALIFERQLEMAEHLLSFGTRVDSRDPQGRTPLHVACWLGDLAAVELLIKYGAEVDTKDEEENTPLIVAVWRGHAPVVKCLLSHRADVNAVCRQGGASALSVAVQEGREEIVKQLLQHNADIEHVDSYGRTPIMVAQKANKEKIVALLNDFQQLPNGNSLLSPGGVATNTTLSGSSGDTKTSGYMSLSQALCSSLESPFATVSFTHPGSPRSAPLIDRQRLNGNGVSSRSANGNGDKNNPLSSLRSAGQLTAGSSSNKSTLSSGCGSPDDDFSRRLLEHSLPRGAIAGRASRPTSVYAQISSSIAEQATTSIFEALSSLLATSKTALAPVEKTMCTVLREQDELVLEVSKCEKQKASNENSDFDSMGDRQYRTRIVTNPKYRQASCGRSEKKTQAEMKTADKNSLSNSEKSIGDFLAHANLETCQLDGFLKKETQL